MQLGKSKTNINVIAAQVLEETAESGSIWGNDTSNDIFTDGDWGQFRSVIAIQTT